MTTFRFAVTLVIAGLVALAPPPTAHGAPSATGDFNGDEHSDLAVGAPMDSVGRHENAGAVNVVYGSAGGGLRTGGDQQFTQGTRGVQGWVEAHDRFGSTLAAADFDGDGYSDLAVGSPGEDASGRRNTGVVHVLYGGPSGITTNAELFGQGFAGVPGTPEPEQNLGVSLAPGDFDGDGRHDLAIGIRDDTVDRVRGAGAVVVMYSTADGIRAGRDQLWTQSSAGVKGVVGSFHRFGASLAAGDLDGDGEDDLAIGIPGGTVNGNRAAGAVSVLYGTGGGLSARRDQLWSQGSRGIKGGPEDSDSFGWALAVGDFDQDGDRDLAVSSPFESIGSVDDAGAVHVLYSSPAGLRSADEMVHQSSRGIKGGAENGDHFGRALAVGDFNGDFEDDLAVGTPLEDIRDLADAGAVTVLYGSERSGITRWDDFWHQGSPGIKGTVQAFDNFGLSVAAGDFDSDRRWDLVASAPRDSVRGYAEAGAVNVIYGRRGGLREDPDELWTQATRGIKGAAGNDRFGAALGSGAPRG